MTNANAEDKNKDPQIQSKICSLSDIFFSHRGNFSDKWEHYLAIYEAELSPLVAAGHPLRLLEVGVQNGGSLQIWRDYLPHGSSIYGIDIDQSCLNLTLGDGIHVLVGDATDRVEIDVLLGDNIFDVIIDDGSHRSEDIIATFDACWHRVAPGGLYIAEDLHCSYFSSHGGGFQTGKSAIEWFKFLADSLNIDHFEQDVFEKLDEESIKLLKSIGKQIARITFYDSMVVIQRANSQREAPYRRIMTGGTAPVVDPSLAIPHLPLGQLRSLFLSPVAADAFEPALRASVVAAREEAEALRHNLTEAHRTSIDALHLAAEAQRGAEAKATQIIAAEAEAAKSEARAAAAEVEAAKSEARAAAAEAEAAKSEARAAAAEVDAIASKARAADAEVAAQMQATRVERAEQEARTITTSTIWRATQPVRTAMRLTPPWMRIWVRRGMKAALWTSTGQLSARLRARRNRTSLPTPPSPLPIMSEPVAQAMPQLEDSYSAWYSAHCLDSKGLRLQRRRARGFAQQPVFSVLVPVFRTPIDVFEAMVASVRDQSYEKWELCLAIVDTGVDAEPLIRAAQAAEAGDARVRVIVLPTNEGISGNSNHALKLATGEWVVLLDHDDTLSLDALFELTRVVNEQPDVDLIHSDKDQVDRSGARHRLPLFKARWSPDTMLNANYLTHITAMRLERLREINGWDSDTDGAQDWDLFLRVIGRNGRVAHVPRILYHWRQIETSVSVGGLEAKPYAARGQLHTVNKYLPVAGWPDASAVYDGHNIRIAWGTSFRPLVSLIILGDDVGGKWSEAATHFGTDLIKMYGDPTEANLAQAVAQAHGEIILLLDGRFSPENSDWLAEMVGPFANTDIALVGGCVRDEGDLIVDFGVFFQDGVPYPAFRGEPLHYFGPAGGCGWYRNAIATAGGALAFRKKIWDSIGSSKPIDDTSSRTDLLFCLEVARRGLGRLLLNPYARFRTSRNIPSLFEETASNQPLQPAVVATALPQGDPFVNPNLDAAVHSGAPRLRTSKPIWVPSHDFAAEARHVAASYDVTSDDITASIAACARATGGPLRRMLWVIPGFEVAFYGGIHTILRTADYMRRERGIEQAFAVLTRDRADIILARIACAFPDLAKSAELATFEGGEIPAQLGQFDAAICTLWTTAYPLLNMRGVRRKFYFLQDWEALFYPAGTISSAVETTYRFGFHGICNTPSLAESYQAFGGQADFFLPAVDSSVFHANGRQPKAPNEPFVLVCYARPGTPRNCFEALSEGLRMLKQRYGDRIEIVSAGSGWDTTQFDLSGVVRNLGLLPYVETGALYRTADAGLVAMATRHPSYLPFELMACGAAVVTTRNPYTTWLLRDGENSLLCEMTRSDIAETVSRLLEDSTLRDKIANGGQVDVQTRHQNWTVTLESIHDSMVRICER